MANVTKPAKLKTLPPAKSASRTRYNNGDAIERAVRKQQRAELLKCQGRARTEEQWRAEYAAAMTETKARSE
jgi:hypothetical protein